MCVHTVWWTAHDQWVSAATEIEMQSWFFFYNCFFFLKPCGFFLNLSFTCTLPFQSYFLYPWFNFTRSHLKYPISSILWCANKCWCCTSKQEMSVHCWQPSQNTRGRGKTVTAVHPPPHPPNLLPKPHYHIVRVWESVAILLIFLVVPEYKRILLVAHYKGKGSGTPQENGS